MGCQGRRGFLRKKMELHLSIFSDRATVFLTNYPHIRESDYLGSAVKVYCDAYLLTVGVHDHLIDSLFWCGHATLVVADKSTVFNYVI